jgi:hypothetical protein
MPLGTLQLIYIGEQNIFITENPQITFFKTVYKRHTNFSIDTVQEFFNNHVGFGQQTRCKLSKNGDLLARAGIYIRLSGLNRTKCEVPCVKKDGCLCTCQKCLLGDEDNEVIYGWANAIGHVLLEWIEVWIGGQMIDRHYGEWLEIWTELTQTSEKRLGYYEMVGKKDPISYTVDSFTGEMELFIPLAFWFCRNIGMALPVLSLIHHDVEFVVKIRDFDQCWVCNKPNVPRPKATIDACVLVDYIYLSLEERHKFYSESHFYLIEQLQLNQNNHSDCNTGHLNIDLYFNHPVKEMIWLIQRQDVVGPPDGVWPEDCSYPKGNDHFNFTTGKVPRLARLTETFSYARLQLSGADRTSNWPASYFRLYQNYYYHTRIPTANYLYTYSFALTPEEHQPTGECNMSMVDNARLLIKLLHRQRGREKYGVNCRIYATNYNVLLVTGGMGGVLFDN